MSSEPILAVNSVDPSSSSFITNGRPSTVVRKFGRLSAFVDGWSLSRRDHSPEAKSTMIIPFGPFLEESLIYAIPLVFLYLPTTMIVLLAYR
ncbi:MAG TPA: hypothetical protein VJ695_05280 [Nitrososphaera sp.]|nr:hypothetical protein [Nitrososphaera sp.]